MYQEFFEKTEVFTSIMADPKYKAFTYNKLPMLGVTKITGGVVPPFDKQGQAANTAAKRTAAGTPTTPEEVIAEWDRTAAISVSKGDAVHAYLEALMNNKFCRYPSEAIMTKFNGDDPVRVKYDKIISQVTSFREQIRGKMIPVASEMVIGSPKYMVCGMVDQIFWNKKAQAFQIWDWKTNTKFDMTSKYPLNDPVAHLSNCKYDEYSLQLAIYKKMFTEETGIPIGDCYICWFSEDQPTHNIFRAKDLAKEAEVLLAKSLADRGMTQPGEVF